MLQAAATEARSIKGQLHALLPGLPVLRDRANCTCPATAVTDFLPRQLYVLFPPQKRSCI